MDVLLGEPENSRASSLSTFSANSVNIPYSSTSNSCDSSKYKFPLDCGDCVPSNRQQSFLDAAYSTSSVLPFVSHKGLLHFGVCPPTQKQHDLPAEHGIPQSQNRQNFVVQNDVNPTALRFTAADTKSLEYNLDSVSWQYSQCKVASTPPGFEGYTYVVTSPIALPATPVVPLLNAVASTRISVASPRSSVVLSQSPVAPLLLTKPFSPTTGTSLVTTGQVTANQERGTGLSPLTTPNQEIGTMSAKTNRKPAKNELYKTELCRAFSEKGSCGYGEKCQFAHGEYDQRTILRHVKYKTKQCWTYHNTGFCYYGARCNFIHDENRSDTSSRLAAGQGKNSDARLDLTSETSSDPSLGLHCNPTLGVNAVPSVGMNVGLKPSRVVYWDPRFKVNSDPNLGVISDKVRLNLNPAMERALSTGLKPNFDSGAESNLKQGISLNSQPKAWENVNPNIWQTSNGTVSISNGMVPVSYGTVPISNGMVRSSPPTTATKLDVGVAPSSGQDPRQRILFNSLEWNFENQRFGHSSVVTDVSPPEVSVGVAGDNDHSRSEFCGVALEERSTHGQSHLSDLSPPQLLASHTKTSSTGVLRPDGYSLGVSLSMSCTESSYLSQASVASANIWSSLIKHPRCWTLS